MHSFLLVLLNSFWQSAILLSIVNIILKIKNNIYPLQKRNFYFAALVLQLLISIISFYCINNDFILFNNDIFSESYLSSLISKNNQLLFYCYVSLVFLKISNLFIQWSFFFYTYKRSIVKTSATLKLFTNTNAALLGITKNISVWYSTKINSPITFGFLKPIIILPFSLCTTLSDKEIEAIILHELTHIKSKDYLLNWVLVVLEIVYVCNPFIYLIIGNIKSEREKNCDIQVLQLNYNKISYAETLLKIARQSISIKNFQIGLTNNKNDLLNRIYFFSNATNSSFKNLSKIYYSLLLLPLLAIWGTSNFKKDNNNFQNEFASHFIVTKDNNFSKKIVKENSEPTFSNTIISNNYILEVKPNEINEKNSETEDLKEVIDNKETNFYKFASFADTMLQTKEFIYNVESPEGKITNTYELKYVEGKWILIPKYLILQKYNDSNNLMKVDSTIMVLDTLIQ